MTRRILPMTEDIPWDKGHGAYVAEIVVNDNRVTSVNFADCGNGFSRIILFEFCPIDNKLSVGDIIAHENRVPWARENLRGPWRLTLEAPYLEADETYDQALITLRWAGE